MIFPPVLYQIQKILADETGVFLVGGAIRNVLLGQENNDLDFTVSGNTGRIARRVCNSLHSDFYTLDSERETYRLIYKDEDENKIHLDFAKMRGAGIDADLAARDFTINAMAVNLNDPLKLIDPLGGAMDLRAKIIKSCNPQSIVDDPIRIIRAVRFAAEGGFKIAEDTKKQMKSNVELLKAVSAERKRDEIFKIISLEQMPIAFRALDWLYAIPSIFSGISSKSDAVEETFKTGIDFASSNEIIRLIRTITRNLQDGEQVSLFMGLADSVLGGFRQKLKEYLDLTFTPDRNYYQLLQISNFFCLLKNRIGILDKVLIQSATQMNLSREEIRFITALISCSGHIENYFSLDFQLTRKGIYKYYKSLGDPGIAATILYLGNVLADHQQDTDPDLWRRQLEKTSILWEAWFDQQDTVVSPKPFLDGNQISMEFGLAPGQLIGKCIEALKSEQAAGNIRSRNEAVEFIRKMLEVLD